MKSSGRGLDLEGLRSRPKLTKIYIGPKAILKMYSVSG